MKEVFTSNGSRDFSQRFKGTFGFYTTPSNKKLLVQISEVSSEEIKFRDRGRQEYTALADKGHEFEFLSPVKRVFDSKGKVCVILRKAARQYQRGISANNTSIIALDGNVPLAPSFLNITAAFADEGFNQNKYKAWLEGERDQVVLSQMLAIVKDKLFLYTTEIGTVDKEKKVMTVDTLWRQEVADCIRDNNLGFAVEVR
jgi:hypothetical protein